MQGGGGRRRGAINGRLEVECFGAQAPRAAGEPRALVGVRRDERRLEQLAHHPERHVALEFARLGEQDADTARAGEVDRGGHQRRLSGARRPVDTYKAAGSFFDQDVDEAGERGEVVVALEQDRRGVGSQRARRREVARGPVLVHAEVKESLRFGEVLEPVLAEVDAADLVECGLDLGAEEDLSTVRGVGDPRGSMHRETDVLPVDVRGLTGVKPHPDAQLAASVRQFVGAHGALPRNRRANSGLRIGKHGKERITLGVHDVPVRRADRRTH